MRPLHRVEEEAAGGQRAPGGALETACIGSADSCGPVRAGDSYDFALRLLKSNLVTSLTLRATSIANTSFDVHFSGGAIAQTSHLRIALEAIETAEGSPLGAPVPLIEESGKKAIRPPTSQDIAATVIRAFGLAPNEDFFIPGAYGEFEGAILPG